MVHGYRLSSTSIYVTDLESKLHKVKKLSHSWLQITVENRTAKLEWSAIKRITMSCSDIIRNFQIIL